MSTCGSNFCDAQVERTVIRSVAVVGALAVLSMVGCQARDNENYRAQVRTGIEHGLCQVNSGMNSPILTTCPK